MRIYTLCCPGRTVVTKEKKVEIHDMHGGWTSIFPTGICKHCKKEARLIPEQFSYVSINIRRPQ